MLQWKTTLVILERNRYTFLYFFINNNVILLIMLSNTSWLFCTDIRDVKS